MALIQCKNGHLYDSSKSAICPYCSGSQDIPATIPLNGSANLNATNGADIGFAKTEALTDRPTVAPGFSDKFSPTIAPIDNPIGATVSLDSVRNSNVEPVRGWLVVVSGKKMGQDFRICTGRNTIGRSKHNNICLDFDPTVSTENSCVIRYDDRNNQFYILDGESKNNIYVNNELIDPKQKLNDNDIVEIGETKLVFRSLCNSNFTYPQN